MGLLDRFGSIGRRTCATCGKEVGPFKRKRLADGHACQDCLALASPFWGPTRKTTVAQLEDHLAYRRRNREAIADFHPDATIGVGRCVLVDHEAGTFVLADEDGDDENPDVFGLSQVRDVASDVHERDVTDTDSDGDTYHDHYEYTFYLVVTLDHPQIASARFAINRRPVINRGRRIKTRDAEAYLGGAKKIKGSLFSNKDDIERYMRWYADLQEMVTGLRGEAGLAAKP